MGLEPILGVPLSVIVLFLLAAGARIFIASEPLTYKGILGQIFYTFFVGFVAYPYLANEVEAKGLITLMLAIGCFAARDILEIVLVLFKQVKNDPLGIVREFLNWRRASKRGDDDR